MKKKELFKKDFARVRRKIEKYNKEFADYVKMTGDNLVPEIDCTIIGLTWMYPIITKETDDGIVFTEDDGSYCWERIEVIEECGELWVTGEENLDEQLKYNRRRLRKGIRVWKSENPDAEMEKEDEE